MIFLHMIDLDKMLKLAQSQGTRAAGLECILSVGEEDCFCTEIMKGGSDLDETCTYDWY